MTFRMGFYEIMKVREYCRGGGGGYNLVSGLHCDTTRVDASFLREPEGFAVETVRGSLQDSGGDEKVRIVF